MPNRSLTRLREPWQSFLSELDEKLLHSVEIRALGAFVLSALYELPRTTGDLDCLSVLPNDAVESLRQLGGKDSELAKKHNIWIQYLGTGIPDLPEDYEECLTELILGLRKLSVLTLDSYDLVLSKLTRNSPKDREDVKFLATKLGLNFSVLYGRFEKEMKPWIANPQRHETTLDVVCREYFQR